MNAVTKKLLSLLLVAVLLVSAVPFQAMATETEGTTETTAPVEVASETEAAPATATPTTITLNGQGGTIGTALTTTQAVTVGQPIGTLPASDVMSLEGYTFTGWYKADGTKVESGTVYDGTYTTIYAGWTLIQKGVTIKGVFGGLKSQAVDISSENVPVSWNLLDYLNKKESEIYPAAGYTWDGCWYDYSTDALIQQNETFSNWRTVYIKFEAKQYKLYFNAGDGAGVDTTEKTVTFQQPVGDLPTPTRPGYVFTGWYDANGNWYNSSTTYTVAGDSTLYAGWKKQASVVLEIFINGKTAEPDRCPVLTGYGKGDIISRSDISTIIKKYYSASSGSSLTIQGLYTSDMWADYLADNSTAGIESIQLQTDEATTYIYVMVNNAKQGSSSTTTTTTTTTSTSTSTSTSSSSTADPTNPQTGDSSMIYVSMTVMLVAATALVAVEILRKRKMI